ncbi:hypothetical protein AVEN_39909-1 [Araneus ventricosus]|uniref:Uncharacterized protein n=1 Tax=Araneus ventricosus TaxID=182803 RepID=A0A4Y2UPN5_ARAVE|nr:hypothetical protein AVEN_39909-1 [Araneus ventricosus]
MKAKAYETPVDSDEDLVTNISVAAGEFRDAPGSFRIFKIQTSECSRFHIALMPVSQLLVKHEHLLHHVHVANVNILIKILPLHVHIAVSFCIFCSLLYILTQEECIGACAMLCDSDSSLCTTYSSLKFVGVVLTHLV